jgi:hypothetical protein
MANGIGCDGATSREGFADRVLGTGAALANSRT